MTREEIESCVQTLRFLENTFLNDNGIFLNDKHPDNIEKIINLLKEKRWISVSERLPEEGVDVLVCVHTGERNYKMMVSRRSDYNYWNGIGRTSNMVAWMLLPEPYKAESEDKE